jgi:hypothetical protein
MVGITPFFLLDREENLSIFNKRFDILAQCRMEGI